MQNIRILALFAVSSLLAACGGGGSDAPATPTAPAAPLSIPLTTAIANMVNLSRSGALTVVGSASTSGQTVNLTGSGTYSEATTAGSFEGAPALRKTLAVNATLVGTAAGQTASAPLNSSSDTYFDSNYKPLGATATGSYCTTTSYTAPPATGQAGTQGDWYRQDCYASSAKTTKLVTVAVKFEVNADSATSLLLKVTTLASTSNGTTVPATATYRVTSTGTVTPLSNSTAVTVSGVSVNLAITYQ